MRRLLAFDPARRHVLCAFAPLDGAETLVGFGAIDLRRGRPTRSSSTSGSRGGLGDVLGRVLIERARRAARAA